MPLTAQEVDIKVKEASIGNQEACKAIYDNFLRYILLICSRYKVSPYDQKDYLQDIFSHCFINIKKYDSSKGEFKYWLRKLAVNIILQKKRKKNILDYSVNVEKLNHHVDATTVDQLQMDDILKLLEKMPEKYATIFNLFVIDGYSNKEISKMLSINEGTVRSYVSRGRSWAAKQIQNIYPSTIRNNTI